MMVLICFNMGFNDFSGDTMGICMSLSINNILWTMDD